jgi:outer membrane receptor protein involved in Fe transport
MTLTRKMMLMLGAGVQACLLAAPMGAAAAEPALVDELIVTAHRREEALQDIPASVTALSDAELRLQGAKDIDDIARLVPGLAVMPTRGAGALPIIRGISSDTGAATVGLYIDETAVQIRPVPFNGNIDLRLFDIERIEVLKGPQGTLWGSSSVGGTIRYISRAPAFDRWSGQAHLEGAAVTDGDADIEAGVAAGGPVAGDRLAVRGSAFYRRDGGFIDRIQRTTGRVIDDDVNRLETVTLRAAADWRPMEGLSVRPSVLYQRAEHDNLDLITPRFGRRKQDFVQDQPETDRFWLPSLVVEFDAPFATLTSATSYFDRRQTVALDVSTALPNFTLFTDYVPGFQDTYDAVQSNAVAQQVWTQELRAVSPAQGRFRWVAGLYFREGKNKFDNRYADRTITAALAARGRPPLQAIFGRPLLPGDEFLRLHFTNVERETAAYFDATYVLAEGLELSAGARVAEGRLRFVNYGDGALNGGFSTASGRQKKTEVSPRVALSWRPVENLLLYASAHKGFRVGGVNPPVPAARCAADLAAIGGSPPATYAPDTLWSYEAGVKGQVPSGRLSFSAAAYRIEWDDIQQLVSLRGCGFAFVGNLGKARSQGVEAEIEMRPLEGLSIGLRGAAVDAEYSADLLSFPAPATQERTVLIREGDDLAGVPRLSLTGTLEYRRPMLGGAGYGRVTAQYVGEYDRTFPPGRTGYVAAVHRGEDYTVLNVRAGLRRGGTDWAVYVNNLGDADPLIGATTNLSPVAGTVRGTTLRPRTVGVSMTRDF